MCVLGGLYLDEYRKPSSRSDVLASALQQQPVVQVVEKKKNLTSLVKDMVLEKFSGKNQNAGTWLTLFERECTRMEIESHKYSEVLRLFLEDSVA